MLHSVWSFRSFIQGLVFKEFRDRSARTIWGHAWLVIEPAVQIGIYVVIFSSVLQAKLPGTGDRLAYSIYLCSGLLTWNFFAGLLLQGRTLFLEHADLLRTMSFPRSTLPLALLGRNVINAGIPIVIFLVLIFIELLLVYTSNVIGLKNRLVHPQTSQPIALSITCSNRCCSSKNGR